MNKIGLYIHVPFCMRKCGYCDFYSLTNLSLINEYMAAAKEYIKYFSKKYKDVSVSTIYFGGGTPSIIGEKNISDLLINIYKYFKVEKNPEITIEVNPETVNEDFFQNIKKSGVNRISFGMQSAVEDELIILNRSHKNEHVIKAVNNAIKAGIDNYSLDIIQSIPYQTEAKLKKTLDFAISLKPKHISSYMLILEKDTPLFKKVEKENVPLLSDDDEGDLYIFTVDYLEKNGFNQYEISNFSKKGHESKHNMIYWKGKNYIGIGPSAHSYMDGKRFFLKNNINSFIKNKLAPKITDDGSGGDLFEYIMLNLRLKNGIDILKMGKKYNITKDDLEMLKKKISRLSQSDVLNYNNKTISLTKNGFLIYNYIITELTNGLDIYHKKITP